MRKPYRKAIEVIPWERDSFENNQVKLWKLETNWIWKAGYRITLSVMAWVAGEQIINQFGNS